MSPASTPSDVPDDATLLRAVAQRDEAAFGTLYDRLSRPVFSMIVRIVQSHAEAEEVLQEAFWQVWERAPAYRPELGSSFTWVVSIARHKAIDRLRASSRHRQRIEAAQKARTDDDFWLPEGPQSMVASEGNATVRDALAKLNVDERRAIALAFFDGLTHEEIALALGVPLGTVKARIRRGLLKLKPELSRLRFAD